MILGSNYNKKKIQTMEVFPSIVNGVIIPYVDSAKFLGVHINRNLSWKIHASLKVSKNIYATEIRK
ncbi:Protein of unknown function [Cotesia congregata]|uniref:Uncharacterized protein n=1 Tax=Cotesia congregata TaxID=51543 RepID=A0A8J2MKX2_COTCN|nr:Protein of unknown function [Cotesia congregata]